MCLLRYHRKYWIRVVVDSRDIRCVWRDPTPFRTTYGPGPHRLIPRSLTDERETDGQGGSSSGFDIKYRKRGDNLDSFS